MTIQKKDKKFSASATAYKQISKYEDELIIVRKEFLIQKEEKENLTAELVIANHELKKAEEHLKEYIQGLEEMIFMTSHKVRQPIAHILGIACLFDLLIDYSADEIKKIVKYIKQSVLNLNDSTKELTIFMSDLEHLGTKPL